MSGFSVSRVVLSSARRSIAKIEPKYTEKINDRVVESSLACVKAA